MKKINNILALLVIALIGLSLTACSSDNLDTNQYRGGISLNAFGPNPVMRGATLRFVGSNLDQVASINIPGIGEVTNFEIIKAGVPSEIRVGIPKDGPEVGKVILKTKTDEKIETLNELTYIEGVEVTGFTPAEADPGTIIRIEGDYLNLIYSLAFADGVLVSSNDFKAWDRYFIEVAVPEEAKTGKIELYTADLTIQRTKEEEDNLEYQTIITDDALIVGTPVTTKLESPRGVSGDDMNVTAKAGEQITLTGKFYNVVDGLKLGDYVTTDFAMSEDGTKLTFTLPAEAPSGAIVLVCKSGVEVPAGFLATVKPTNCVATPKPVKTGQTLTVNGNDMDLVIDIVFADAAGEFVLTNNQNIINTKEAYAVTVPAEAIEGTLKLAMANGELIDVDFTLVKPTVTGYDVNPVSAGGKLTIKGTDLDLVKTVQFGEGSDIVAVEGASTAITLNVPMNAKTGSPTLTLANGYTVQNVPSITIEEAVFCYVTEKIWETQEIELKAGDSFTVPIANGDKLTGVEINGTACQYVLTSNNTQLIVGIPANAKKGSTFRLISSNGEISYTVDFTPNTEVNTVLWTGLADLKNWSFNWEIGKGTNGDNNPNMFKDMDLQEGDVIRVYLTPVDGWWMVKFYDGHWAEHLEAGVAAGLGETCEISASNYNLDEHGGCIEFTATAKMVEQLTTLTDWGMCWIMMGQAVITKISVTHYNSLETTVWTGEAVADNWGDQPYILSDGGIELLAAGMKVGSLIRVYITATDASWNCQLVDGHWSPNTPFPGCDFNNGNWDLAEHGGALELQVTDYVYEHITSTQGWGGSFLLNGDNVICTKVTVE